MQVPKVKSFNRNYQCNPSLKGKLFMSDKMNFYNKKVVEEGLYWGLKKIVDKMPKGDLIICENRKERVLKIIAQKAEDFERGSGKYEEVRLPANVVLPLSEYLSAAEQVAEKYNRPSGFEKFCGFIKNKFSNLINKTKGNVK